VGRQNSVEAGRAESSGRCAESSGRCADRRARPGIGGRGSACGVMARIEVENPGPARFGRIVQGRRVDVEAGIGVEADVVPGRTACG